MKVERALGFDPVDRELEKLGYDIESRVPGTGRLRKFKLDDVVYERKPTDDIFEIIRARTNPVSEVAWLFVAFAAVWLGLGAYLLSLSLRQRRLEERLRQLERDE